MTTIAEGIIEVRADTSGVSSDINRGVSSATGSAKTGGAKVGKAFALGFAGAATVAFAGVSFLKDAFGEAEEARKVGAITANAIKVTGGAANVTAKGVANLAEAISNKAGMDDEAIQSGANLLLTFKNIRNEVGQGSDVFNRATEAAVDLSAAGFGSIESGSKMLGKALNDPVAGITALSRAGVTFSEEQKKTIGRMVETNNVLGAQKLILKEVESQVGGAAAAQATAADKMTVAWNNFKEDAGEALMPTFNRFFSYMTDEGIPKLEAGLKWFESDGIGYLTTFAEGAADVAGSVRDMVKWLNDLPDPVKLAALAGALGGGAALKLRGGKGALGAVGSALGMAKPTPVFVTNPGFGKGGTLGTLGKIAATGAAGAGGLASILGKFPKLVPLIPFAAGPSAPGQDSLLKQITGFGPGSNEPSNSNMSPEMMNIAPKADFGPFLAAIKGTAEEVAGFSAGLEKLPKTIQTRFDLLGVPESKAEAKNLVDVYNLTPKEKRTMFRMLGFSEAKGQTEKLISEYNLTPGQKTTNFDVKGVDYARQQLASFTQNLAQIRDKTVTVTTVFTSSGQRFKEFANGTASAPGGMAWVGERGPELMHVPRGAEVIPHERSRRMASQSSDGGGGSLRLVEGRLAIDANGDAYIRGLAAEEVAADAAFGSTLGRMGRR